MNIRRQNSFDYSVSSSFVSQNLNSESIQMIYKMSNCVNLLNAESERRIVDSTVNFGTRRRIPILCLFKQFKNDAHAQQSALRVERFNAASNEFIEAAFIDLGQRIHFELIVHQNKAYILGGCINNVVQNTVSGFKAKICFCILVARVAFLYTVFIVDY